MSALRGKADICFCAAQCPLLAQSGHELLRCTCLLLGVKRTSRGKSGMSACGFSRHALAPRNCHFWRNSRHRNSRVQPKQVTRDLALKLISHTTAAPQSHVSRNFSLGLPPTRLIHSLKKSANDTPQDADGVYDRVARGRIVINVRV